MKRATRMMLIACVGIGGAAGVMWQYQGYTRRASALEGEIGRYRAALAERDATMSDKGRIARELKKAGETTLGTD
jgi:hypothetical protein